MKTLLIKHTAPLALLAATGLAPAMALAGGHYTPGVQGITAASVPPPGFYYAGYLVNYRFNKLQAPGSSNALPGTNKGNVTAYANRFVWITQQKILGADYGMETIIPIVRSSFNFNGLGKRTKTGVADIYLGPLILAWHGAQWDLSAGAGLWLDNAPSSKLADPGKGYKSWMLSAGGTYYFDTQRTWAFSALSRFEINTKDKHRIRPGNDLTVEWGLSKKWGRVQAGLVGYSQWQTSADSGPGAGKQKMSRHAVGAEAGYAFPQYKAQVNLSFYQEVSAKAGTAPQPKGKLARLTLMKAF